jgi:hypothetical protein
MQVAAGFTTCDAMISIDRHRQTETPSYAEWQHAAYAISQVATFSGICAGAPGADIIAYIRTQQDVRQFRTGYVAMAAVCAFLMLIELAMLPGVRAAQHHATAAAPAPAVNTIQGR